MSNKLSSQKKDKGRAQSRSEEKASKIPKTGVPPNPSTQSLTVNIRFEEDPNEKFRKHWNWVQCMKSVHGNEGDWGEWIKDREIEIVQAYRASNTKVTTPAPAPNATVIGTPATTKGN